MFVFICNCICLGFSLVSGLDLDLVIDSRLGLTKLCCYTLTL